MNIIIPILFFTSIGVAIFLYFYFIPFIKNKMFYWKTSRMVRKMAKKYDGELANDLNKIADMLKNAAKREKLVDDDE